MATDLLLGNALAGTVSRKSEEKWTPLFSSKAFAKEHKDVELNDYRLSDDRCLELGVKISDARAKVLKTAKEIKDQYESDHIKDLQYVSRLDQKLRRRGSAEANICRRQADFDFREPVPISRRHRGKKRTPANLSEKIDIVYAVIIE